MKTTAHTLERNEPKRLTWKIRYFHIPQVATDGRWRFHKLLARDVLFLASTPSEYTQNVAANHRPRQTKVVDTFSPCRAHAHTMLRGSQSSETHRRELIKNWYTRYTIYSMCVYEIKGNSKFGLVYRSDSIQVPNNYDVKTISDFSPSCVREESTHTGRIKSAAQN